MKPEKNGNVSDEKNNRKYISLPSPLKLHTCFMELSLSWKIAHVDIFMRIPEKIQRGEGNNASEFNIITLIVLSEKSF